MNRFLFAIDPRDGETIPREQELPHLANAILPQVDEAALFVSVPAGTPIGTRLHVSFRARVTDSVKYSSVRFCHADGTTIDYGLESHTWSRLNFDADVVERDGIPCIALLVKHAAGKRLDFTCPTFANDPLPTGDLLGGVTLTQIVAARRLAMGYFLTTPEDHLIVIDGGRNSDTEQVGELIAAHAWHVDGWYLTHYHGDHIAPLIGLLKQDNDLVIDNLVYDFNIAEEILAEREDTSNPLIAELNELVKHSGKVKRVTVPHKGDVFTHGNLRIKVLNDAYFGSINNLCNDSSVVFKAETPQENVLFLGDLGSYGAALLEDPDFRREIADCMIVQMAHHGQEGVSQAVYRAMTKMKICLYSAQAWLFDNDKGEGLGTYILETMQTREWMRELDVRRTYTMIEGRVILR